MLYLNHWICVKYVYYLIIILVLLQIKLANFTQIGYNDSNICILLLATPRDLEQIIVNIEKPTETQPYPRYSGSDHTNVKFRFNELLMNTTEIVAINYHYRRKLIYFSDRPKQMIFSVPFVDSNTKSNQTLTVIQRSANAEGLACDWLTDKLYWTDRDSDHIEVSMFDGSMRKSLFWTHIQEPRAIALAPMKGLLFWSDWGDMPKIERASMDGNPRSRKVIVSDNIVWPNGLTIDLQNERIYWSDGKLNLIESIDFNGNDRSNLLSGHDLIRYPFAMSLFKHMLFWTDWQMLTVYAYDMSLNQTHRVIYRSNLIPMDVKVWHLAQQPYNTNPCEIRNGNCSHLCLLADNSIGYTCACPNTIRMVDNFTCANGNIEILLVARKDGIMLIYLDSPEFTSKLIPLDGVNNAVGIEFDLKTNTFLWSDVINKRIEKAALTGKNRTTIINENLYSPDGLFVDQIVGNLYWTDSISDRIQVCRLDGSHRRVLIQDGLYEPRGISVASDYGLMFWSDWNATAPKIERSYLDGTNRIKIVTESLKWPNMIAIDFDSLRVYWCDASLDRIESVQFDGSDRKLLINRELYHPFGLTLLGRYVYWTDWQGRSVSRVDKFLGTNIEQIANNVPNTMSLKAIELNSAAMVSRNNNPCAINNGDCSQLCLNKPNGIYVCRCELEYELLLDGKTCQKPETAIFYVQKNTMSRLTIGMLSQMTQTTLGKVRHLKAFDVDPITQTIYWSNDKYIMFMRLKDCNNKVFAEVDIDDVNGIAIDWIGRNLFWTDSGTNKIQVVRLDGFSRKVLIWKDILQPKNIVLDPMVGLIFWIEVNNGKISVKRAQMNGEKIKVLVKNLGLLTTFTIYRLEKRLFLNIRIFIDDVAYIKSCNYDGSHMILVYETKKYEIPITFAVFEKFLYWTTINSSSLWRADLYDINNRQLLSQNFSNVSALLLITNRFNNDMNLCSVNNNTCSNMCLMVSSDEYTCACPTHHILLANNTCLEPQKFLLLSERSSFFQLNLQSDEYLESKIPIGRLKNVRAVDYNPFSNEIFYIDGRSPSTIKRAFINDSLINSGNPVIIINKNEIETEEHSKPIDLAIDPLAQHLYWVCENENAIIVSHLHNGSNIGKVVGGSLSRESPRMIALNIKKRMMIWTDTANESQLIRARMDGSYRVVIRRTTNNITAIAIDVETDMIVWAETNSIIISNIEGENQYTIVKDPYRHITKLVYTGSIYWYDKIGNKIETQDLLSGQSQPTIVKTSIQITDMTLINVNLYISSCTAPHAPHCSHLCIESERRPVCACPLGETLDDNQRTCSLIKECEPNHFTCASLSFLGKDCIPVSWRCDGQGDCPDKSDEIGCSSCSPEQFRCQNGQCIDPNLVCDGIFHCSDAFDERHCCKSPQEFQCPHTDVCIDSSLLCDGMENCADGADESPTICTINKPQIVEATQITVHSTRSTITVTLFISIVIVILVLVFLCKIRQKIFKTRPIVTVTNTTATTSIPMTLSRLRTNSVTLSSPLVTGTIASDPLYPSEISDRMYMSIMDTRTHITGKSSSTNGSSSGGVSYLHIITNPPPSPVRLHEPYKNYKTINQPPPPTPCSTVVWDESDYD